MSFLAGLFLALLALHLGHSVVANRRPEPVKPARRGRLVLLVTQTPLFLLACYFGAQEGVFSRQLVNPVYIGVGLLAGHLIFVLSLLVTHRSWDDAHSHFLDLGGVWNFTVENPVVLYRFLTVAVAEELIWRVGAQPLLIGMTGSPAAGIILVAVAFAIVHRHFFQNSPAVSFEFLVFSLLLGGMFYWTGSLILVIVVHAVRDIEIAYLEYAIKVYELGDEEEAVRHIEQQYMPQRTEHQ